jgi:hypothetical protein
LEKVSKTEGYASHFVLQNFCSKNMLFNFNGIEVHDVFKNGAFWPFKELKTSLRTAM